MWNCIATDTTAIPSKKWRAPWPASVMFLRFPGLTLSCFLALHLLGRFHHRTLHLFGSNVAHVRGHRPHEAVRIDNVSVAVAPELIHERHLHLGTCRDGLGEEFVNVVNVNVNREA